MPRTHEREPFVSPLHPDPVSRSKACCIGCFTILVLTSCTSSMQKKVDADRKSEAIVSVLPANEPLVDNSGGDAHRRVKACLAKATRFVFADRVSHKKVKILKADEVLPPINAILVRSATRISNWGEFREWLIGRHLWVVFFDENGQLAGALHGRDRHYEVHLGAKQLESGIIELSDSVEPFIRTTDGTFLARKMPPGSPNPVRICNQGIIFKKDPFDPHQKNY